MKAMREIAGPIPSIVCGFIAISIIVNEGPFWRLLLPSGLFAAWWLFWTPFRLAVLGKHRIEMFDFAIAGMAFAASFAFFAAFYGLHRLSSYLLFLAFGSQGG